MIWMLLTIMIVLLVLGFPMKVPMLLAPLVVLIIYYPNVNPMMVAQQLISGVQPFVLLAIPMFMFAADIMCAGRTSNRLLDFVESFVGHFSGGMAVTTACACTLFGSISGSTQATVVAIGRPMRDRLLRSGYEDRDIMALIINASDIAFLIPPSIGMIMFGVISGTSVGELFIAGIGPGLLILCFFCIFSVYQAKRKKIPRLPRADARQRWQATKGSILTFGFPVIIIGGIYSGFFSPTEAAAASVLYAFILEVLVYRSVSIRDIPGLALSTGVVTTVVFLLVGAGTAFAWIISYARIPQMITSGLLGPDPTSTAVLITVSIFFFIGCMFVDPIVVIIILTPIFYPVALQAGIDPVHLGVIATLQVAIGSATPPFGCDIFTACAIFDKSYYETIRGTPPYILILLLVSLIIIFVPEVSLLIRDLAFGYR